MKIFKITDGFITNSSTQSTTVMLAIRKDFDYETFFKNIDIPANIAEFYLDFKKDHEDFYDLIERYCLDLVFLEKDYEFFYNYIDDIDVINALKANGVENPGWSEESEIYDKVYNSMKSKDKILILKFGDLHGGEPYISNPPILYTKNEVISIFKSDNVPLIRSLFVNKILEKLKSKPIEVIELVKSLRIPLKELIKETFIEEEDNLPRISFEKGFYDIWGEKYFETLFEFIVYEDKSGDRYLNEENIITIRRVIRPYSIEHNIINSVRSKFIESLYKALPILKYENDKNGYQFFADIHTIDTYFMNRTDLLFFLDKNDDIHYLTDPVPSEGKSFQKKTIDIVKNTISKCLRSNDRDIQEAAEKLREKLKLTI